MRIIIVGAEKCPLSLFERCRQLMPGAIVLEGYGITECAPIVSANHERDPRAGTIGRIMPSVEYVVVDVDTNQEIPRPAADQA